MSEPAFDQLRTKEQLGYIVFTGIKRLNQQYLALHLIVQSSHKDADFLDGRVEDFLENYREQLLALTEEAFAANVAAVIEKLVEKPKNIDQVRVLLFES
jgi:insulysin